MATNKRASRGENGKFVVNGTYLRQQASEAVRTFIAPFSGVYGAATGVGRAESPVNTEGKKERAA